MQIAAVIFAMFYIFFMLPYMYFDYQSTAKSNFAYVKIALVFLSLAGVAAMGAFALSFGYNVEGYIFAIRLIVLFFWLGTALRAWDSYFTNSARIKAEQRADLAAMAKEYGLVTFTDSDLHNDR